MPQDTTNNECQQDQNFPYMRDRHEDFQLAEVDEILRYPDPSKIMSEPPILPKGGEVYLYRPKALDRRVRDQYWWVNRGNNFHSKGQKRPTIMKTYFSLKDRNGGRKSDCLNGFRRHLYRLADAKEDEAIIFIHYLGDETLHKPMPHGNTKLSWHNQPAASSRDSTVKICEEIPNYHDFPATGRYQNKVMTRNANNIGSKRSSIPANVRTQSNLIKPGVSSVLSDKVRQTLTNNRKRLLVPGWNTNKTETNKVINSHQFLHNNSSPAAKMAKVTINLTENEQQMSLSRTNQHDIQPPTQVYIHQSISNPAVSRRMKLSTPASSISQQPRPQRTFSFMKQQVKPVSLIKNQNSLQLSARTQEQPMKVRHLTNSLASLSKTRLPTSSQVILHEALQQEPGKQSYISPNDQVLNRGQDMSDSTLPCGSNFITQNSQPLNSGLNSSQNSSCAENSVPDDSTLPLDYEKFFEEASKLPRMGCDVFVLVSYPGCKPAYWGTDKYVKKFENSERLLPFSASGCLSVKLKGSTDKQNLLANNLELSQHIQPQSDEIDSAGTGPNLRLVIKEEFRENNGDEDSGIAQDVVKQEPSDVENSQPLIGKRQARIKVTAQRSNNSSRGKTDAESVKNSIPFKGNYQYKQQLNTTNEYGDKNSYGFFPENSNSLGNRLSLVDKQATSFYDKVLVYKDKTSGESLCHSPSMDKEGLSTGDSMHRLQSEIVEPSRVLIKVEPETDDYGELNSLVYTEYG